MCRKCLRICQGSLGEETLPPLSVGYEAELVSDWYGALSHQGAKAVVQAVSDPTFSTAVAERLFP